jgi:hypothetical protein
MPHPDTNRGSGAAPRRGNPAAEDAAPRTRVRRLAGSRVVAYHPSFAAIAGGVTAGLFLAQLFYWHDKGSDPDGWIYKTQAEWEEETGLSRWEQETARRRLRERGLVEEKLAGLPARLHYRLDVERLIALLSARVERTPAPPAGGEGEEGGGGGRRRAAVERVTPPRTRTRERHNQACGVPTNKHVGIPQTSSRGCHTHAETTIEHSREEGSERLAGSLPGPPGPRAAAGGATAEGPASAGRDGGASTVLEGPPPERECSLHGVPMRLRQKDGDHWYSHRLRDGRWCKGAPGDQGPGEPDPQSSASRQEYLAWAAPVRDVDGVASRREYAAWAARVVPGRTPQPVDGAWLSTEKRADGGPREVARGIMGDEGVSVPDPGGRRAPPSRRGPRRSPGRGRRAVADLPPPGGDCFV